MAMAIVTVIVAGSPNKPIFKKGELFFIILIQKDSKREEEFRIKHFLFF